MKTPLQELIEQLKEAKSKETCASLSMEDGFDRAIEIAEAMLKKEYETGVDTLFQFAEFANNFLEPHIPPFTKDDVEQFYNETFNTKER